MKRKSTPEWMALSMKLMTSLRQVCNYLNITPHSNTGATTLIIATSLYIHLTGAVVLHLWSWVNAGLVHGQGGDIQGSPLPLPPSADFQQAEPARGLL